MRALPLLRRVAGKMARQILQALRERDRLRRRIKKET